MTLILLFFTIHIIDFDTLLEYGERILLFECGEINLAERPFSKLFFEVIRRSNRLLLDYVAINLLLPTNKVFFRVENEENDIVGFFRDLRLECLITHLLACYTSDVYRLIVSTLASL